MWGRASCQDKWGALNRKGTAWWAGKGPEVLSAHVRQSRICTFPGASGVALPVASCGGPGQPWRSEGDRSGPRPAPTSTPVPRSHQLKMIFRNSVIFFFFLAFSSKWNEAYVSEDRDPMKAHVSEDRDPWKTKG